jgi:hypothetical protein
VNIHEGCGVHIYGSEILWVVVSFYLSDIIHFWSWSLQSSKPSDSSEEGSTEVRLGSVLQNIQLLEREVQCGFSHVWSDLLRMDSAGRTGTHVLIDLE